MHVLCCCRFKEADIPWTWEVTQEVQHAALTLLHEYLQASMAEAAYLTLTAESVKGTSASTSGSQVGCRHVGRFDMLAGRMLQVQQHIVTQ
jgi:hypothetical protein